MERLIASLKALWADKHLRWLVGVFVGLVFVCEIGPIWLPAYKAQFDQTNSLVARIAILFSFLISAAPAPPTDDKKT
jgi:hypothetical protein